MQANDLGTKLRQFADSLNRDSFEPLSPGIGLGEVVAKPIYEPQVDLKFYETKPQTTKPVTPSKDSQPLKPTTKAESWTTTIVRSILAFSADILVVLVSLCVAFVGLYQFVFARTLGPFPEIISGLREFKTEWLALFCFSFAVYWILFRVIARRTVGERIFP